MEVDTVIDMQYRHFPGSDFIFFFAFEIPNIVDLMRAMWQPVQMLCVCCHQ